MAGGYRIGGFLLRAVLNAVVLFIFVTYISVATVDTLGGTLFAAALFGVLNAAVRIFFTFLKFVPGSLTLFVCTLLTNALLFSLMAKTLPGIRVPAFFDFVSLMSLFFLTLTSFILSKYIKDR